MAYNSFKDWPCRPHHITNQYSGSCPLFEFKSIEAIDAHEKASIEAAQKWVLMLEAGTCPDCGQPTEPRRQVGRCVYGACGHRLYQGKL